MARVALIAIIALFVRSDLAREPSLPTGPQHMRIADLLANLSGYDDVPVTITGCYGIDPYHGSVVGDRSAGIEIFGDVKPPENFDWTRQRVCGAFLGRLQWAPSEEPLSLLCDACFVVDKTLRYRIVNDPDLTPVTSPPAHP